MTMPKIIRTLDDADRLIRDRTSFQCRARRTPYGTLVSMSGLAKDPDSTGIGGYVSLGRSKDDDGTDSLRYLRFGGLPTEYLDSCAAADFVVYSYDTPIAWHHDRPHDLTPELVESWLADEADGVWIIPDVRYTVTTTKHQSTVRSALGGYAYGLYGKKPDGSTDYSTRAPSLPSVNLVIAGAPERVEGFSVERYGW